MTEKTIVIFRKFKDEGDIIALFPNEVADNNGNCSSYQRLGQHGVAGYSGVVYRSIAASPEEYASLKGELESIGYVLDVKKRFRVSKNQPSV